MQKISSPWWYALVCTLWLFALDARADQRYGKVSLDLQAGNAEVPTHLCVVSASRSDFADKRLWTVLEPDPDEVASSTGRTSKSWRVKPSVWQGDQASVDNRRCADDPITDCRPRVELPGELARQTDLYVACRADRLTEGGAAKEPRPLFILLEFLGGSPPEIESIDLAGGVASIGVFGASVDQVEVTARSLGGHYLPHQRSQQGQRVGREVKTQGPRRTSIRLDLESRCRVLNVRLPRNRVTPDDRDRLSVRVHGISIDVD